jgi:hypothetical protein
MFPSQLFNLQWLEQAAVPWQLQSLAPADSASLLLVSFLFLFANSLPHTTRLQ